MPALTFAFRTEADVARALPDVVAHLGRGGLVVHPTETVYGVGGLPRERPLARLAALKGRASTQPVLLLVDGLARISELGLEVQDNALRFARAFWPGPLTLVLPSRGGALPGALRGATGGVAVRWTAHPGAAAIVSACNSAITSTSANPHGTPPAVDVAAIEEWWRDPLESGELLVLDAGPLAASPPSTILDCTSAVPVLVREGAIRRAALAAVDPILAGEV